MSLEKVVEIKDTAYDAASNVSRAMRNMQSARYAPDVELQTSQDTLVARCRDFYINNPLAKAIIDRIVNCVCGNGLKLQISVNDPDREIATKFEQFLEAKFLEWSKECDFLGINDFGSLQCLCLRSLLLSGDVLVNTVYEDDLKLHVFEADQISNPSFGLDSKTMRAGVETTEYGKPIAYHVMRTHPGELYPEWVWDRIPVYGEESGIKRVFHLFLQSRPGQHRGVPLLAPVLVSLRFLDKYSQAEMTAAYMASCVSLFIQSSPGTPVVGQTDTEKKTMEVAPGMIVELEPGEIIVPFNPQRPNSSYSNFVRAKLEEIGAGVGLPMEFILMSFNASYSASRASILQAWKTIMIYRQILIKQLCEPVFNLWLLTLGLDEKIIARIKAKWIGPARGDIDEYKEILSAKERITLGLSSRKEECEELRGTDWLDVHQQLALEELERQRAGLAISNQPTSFKPVEAIENDEQANPDEI